MIKEILKLFLLPRRYVTPFKIKVVIKIYNTIKTNKAVIKLTQNYIFLPIYSYKNCYEITNKIPDYFTRIMTDLCSVTQYLKR